MLLKVLKLLGVLFVALVIFEVAKWALVLLGIILPALILTLIGVVIAIGVAIYGVKLFGVTF